MDTLIANTTAIIAQNQALTATMNEISAQYASGVAANTALVAQNSDLVAAHRTLVAQVGEFARENRALEETAQAASLRFAKWSIPQLQLANRNSTSSERPQIVAFPDGSWPEDTPGLPRLSSVQSILDLDFAATQAYFTRYQLSLPANVPTTEATLKAQLQQHINVPAYMQRSV
ncbi:hypothetical protein FRC04_007180 [Tulasnella sp. 424]|nr:hypothetical protein FRC04_007180 [Tulasnella sp. 424]KAG8974616.1 hypothetical protein FRC05_007092 [Tulasnella sp. 425]